MGTAASAYLVLRAGHLVGIGLPAEMARHYGMKVGIEDAPRTAAERRLMAALEALFAKLLPDLAARIAGGEMPDEATLQAAFRRVIEPQLIEAAVDEFERLGVSVGVQFDPAQVSQEAVAWAREYSYNLVKGLTETVRVTLQDAFTQVQTTPGMTRRDLEALLEPLFGSKRAESISITEITRSYQASIDRYQVAMQAQGLTFQRIFHTNRDVLVCHICLPDDGKPESEWGSGPPPRHPRCRCSTTLQFVDTTTNG